MQPRPDDNLVQLFRLTRIARRIRAAEFNWHYRVIPAVCVAPGVGEWKRKNRFPALSIIVEQRLSPLHYSLCPVLHASSRVLSWKPESAVTQSYVNRPYAPKLPYKWPALERREKRDGSPESVLCGRRAVSHGKLRPNSPIARSRARTATILGRTYGRQVGRWKYIADSCRRPTLGARKESQEKKTSQQFHYTIV